LNDVNERVTESPSLTRKLTTYLASNNQLIAYVKSEKITKLHESKALIISNVTCSITITFASPAQRKPRKAMAVGAFVNTEMEKQRGAALHS
jgi:hypothetical protein